ncbi:Endonuclease/exonuclease/phosphatase [Suillus paluster]|uniref:Endonuclease/exonuclease/phosphatase n=1 Tax=Suillus paluster TaxID=48578 RepID=UPI001B85BEE2|nr:Endonuclease/exonuclease/phosphatase [Suillus paluster]KAG1732241.1 Endonuclease/exonuclease/phosphatase [Suillus paluster]
MKERTSVNLTQNPTSKWTTVNQTMQDQKIGILCIQETHLTNEHETQIDTLFSRCLRVLNTSDPLRPGSSAGIAFILNKELTNASNANMEILIPGRAAILSLNWHNNETIRILNVYTPNNANEHHDFWNKIKTEWSRLNISAIDFMLGDFNLTENPIDRAPTRLDNKPAINALRELQTAINVHNTWWNEHPHHRLFTFSSNCQTLSRLDRIYTSEQHTESMLDWNMNVSQIPSDHQMVSVRFAPPGLPHIGRGRWTWPIGVMTDKDLIQQIIKIGNESQQEIDALSPRNNETNPQTIWESFKNKITATAKETTKKHLAKINQRIRALTKDLQRTSNSKDIDSPKDTRINRVIIEQEIDHLQKNKISKRN